MLGDESLEWHTVGPVSSGRMQSCFEKQDVGSIFFVTVRPLVSYKWECCEWFKEGGLLFEKGTVEPRTDKRFLARPRPQHLSTNGGVAKKKTRRTTPVLENDKGKEKTTKDGHKLGIGKQHVLKKPAAGKPITPNKK